ncbi:NADP-dependent malic enzyme [Zea mays]|uniref:NADP-dependent malic enzyme n=1 Tax=Zea mays TaxID=4577 RepID=A0A317Y342_MAIZE|nr:NADP-dependent malic enzyme [Zea mays]
MARGHCATAPGRSLLAAAALACTGRSCLPGQKVVFRKPNVTQAARSVPISMSWKQGQRESIERAQLGGIAKWAYGAGSGKHAIYHQFCSRGEKGEKGGNRIEEAHRLRLLDNRYLQWRCINARTDATLLVQSFTAERLIVASREETLQPFKKRYAHEHEPVKDLLGAVKAIRSTALIGSAGVGQSFTKEVIEAIPSINEGRAIFGSGSPFDPVKYNNEKLFVPAQANNAYIFPGFGLGVVISGAVRVSDDMVLAAALVEQETPEHIEKGLIYLPFSIIRKISANIDVHVAAKAYDLGMNGYPAPSTKRPGELYDQVTGDVICHGEKTSYKMGSRAFLVAIHGVGKALSISS